MKKFAIEVTKGNTDTVIRTFETKEEAMQFGAEYFKTMPRDAGVLSCVEAEFDEIGQRVNNEERLYHTWY